MMKIAFVSLLLVAAVSADVYMHSPRGQNNRLDEANRDRTNGNRLYDSQNNDRGGSNVGEREGEGFYEGSILPIEWTNQHTCGQPTIAGTSNNDCNVVMQYMCDARLRDGTTTDTIPNTNADCADNNCDADEKYGRHESQQFYKMCLMTQRNYNLYTANQNVNGNQDNNNGATSPNGLANADATATRQNPNGARRGYECAEEREYYPYWRGSPWVDVAVFTNTPERCEQYIKNSQNVTPRAACQPPANLLAAREDTKGWIPADKAACIGAGQGYTWVENAVPAHNIPAPLCLQSFNTRDNQLGTTDNSNGETAGFNTAFNWTIPAGVSGANCAVRIRYNISSSENGGEQSDLSNPATGAYGWASLSSVGPGIDKLSNQNPPGQAQNNNKPSKLNVWSQFGLPASAVQENNMDYAMRNNPQVSIFTATEIGNQANGDPVRFQLAINTNQFFRTFEDRTHTIKLGIPRPLAIPDAIPIHNLNVRGKRGNIVQTYPGTEYDHNPNRLTMRVNDFVHFQWTGSDTNPANNAGEGNAGEDRSNAILLRKPAYDENGAKDNKMATKTNGGWGRSYPVTDISPAGGGNFLAWPADMLDRLAVFGIKNSYVDNAPQQVGEQAVGVWNYMSTRNNNFTNRSQKAQIVVSRTFLSTARMNYSGGHVFSGRNYMRVHAGTLAKEHKVIFTGGPSADEWESDWVNVEVYAEGQARAHEFQVRPGMEDTIDLGMAYTPSPFTKPQMYRTIDGETTAVKATYNDATGLAMPKVSHGGMYVIKSHLNVELIVGLGAATLFIMGTVVAGAVAAFRKQAKA